MKKKILLSALAVFSSLGLVACSPKPLPSEIASIDDIYALVKGADYGDFKSADIKTSVYNFDEVLIYSLEDSYRYTPGAKMGEVETTKITLNQFGEADEDYATERSEVLKTGISARRFYSFDLSDYLFSPKYYESEYEALNNCFTLTALPGATITIKNGTTKVEANLESSSFTFTTGLRLEKLSFSCRSDDFLQVFEAVIAY